MSEQTQSPEIIERRKNFILSPSSLIDFEKSGKCLHKWYKYWIERAWVKEDSLSMLEGRYFEYLCLGAPPWGDAVISLPLTQSGAKTVTQIRIEHQAEKFRNFFNPNSPDFCGDIIIAKHVKASTTKPSTLTKGIWDFLTENVYTKRRTIYEMKLTQSVDSLYGPQPWGDVTSIDPLQLGTYKAQYIEKYNDEDVDTKYYVAEHGPRTKTAIIELQIGLEQLLEIDDRYEKAYETINLASQVDFEQWTPSWDECKNCKIADCKARYQFFNDMIDTYTN